MSVQRWVLRDPYDTNGATNTYTFPRNPASMTSPHRERQVASFNTTTGKILLREGAPPAKQWQFSGPILDKDHYTALHDWVYKRQNRVQLTDHYGRILTLVFSSFDTTPVRRVGYYWSFDYTISALVVSITAPTVGPSGPV